MSMTMQHIKNERHAILMAASLTGSVGPGMGSRGSAIVESMIAAKELRRRRHELVQITPEGRRELGRLSLGDTAMPRPVPSADD